MIPKLMVHPDPDVIISEAESVLEKNGLSRSHPDLLWIEEEKLGVEQAKQIRAHLALKPFQADGKAVVIIHAQNLTPDAQNALLKTLEEPSGEAIILLGMPAEDSLLPTISSRSEIVFLKSDSQAKKQAKYLEDIKQIVEWSMEKRFQYIEKLEDKQAFLEELVEFYRQQKKIEVLKSLLQAEQWAKSNVNMRAVLEYLMLKL